MPRQKYGSEAFTLVEIVLVVLIISILTVVGIPSFRTLYIQSEMRGAAIDFLGALRYAQQRAIMERIPIRIVVDSDDSSYWIPVEQEKERRHYKSRSNRRRSPKRGSSSSRRRRVREIKEIQGVLPPGFEFSFLYNVAEEDEIRRGEGEFYFYPDGSAQAAFFTILRLGKREDERRIFIKISPSTGMAKTMESTTDKQGSDFYRGYYDYEDERL